MVSPGKRPIKKALNFTRRKRERDFSSIYLIKNPKNAVEKEEKIDERKRKKNKDRKK